MNFIFGCCRKWPVLLVALGLGLPMAPAQAADTYPSRPVRIVTPANPGGTTDFLARLLAAHLTKIWGQQAIVDNRGSASGVNGAEIVKNAAPDGYCGACRRRLVERPQTNAQLHEPCAHLPTARWVNG